ncbi:unnamed protein product [Linum trigynum]|uniref:Uncharacterized protein n=1 Tax=Linum trigynum TaxID=586398 RepID=A0AAV2EY45_9ROSI
MSTASAIPIVPQTVGGWIFRCRWGYLPDNSRLCETMRSNVNRVSHSHCSTDSWARRRNLSKARVRQEKREEAAAEFSPDGGGVKSCGDVWKVEKIAGRRVASREEGKSRKMGPAVGLSR